MPCQVFGAGICLVTTWMLANEALLFVAARPLSSLSVDAVATAVQTDVIFEVVEVASDGVVAAAAVAPRCGRRY